VPGDSAVRTTRPPVSDAARPRRSLPLLLIRALAVILIPADVDSLHDRVHLEPAAHEETGAPGQSRGSRARPASAGLPRASRSHRGPLPAPGSRSGTQVRAAGRRNPNIPDCPVIRLASGPRSATRSLDPSIPLCLPAAANVSRSSKGCSNSSLTGCHQVVGGLSRLNPGMAANQRLVPVYVTGDDGRVEQVDLAHRSASASRPLQPERGVEGSRHYESRGCQARQRLRLRSRHGPRRRPIACRSLLPRPEPAPLACPQGPIVLFCRVTWSCDYHSVARVGSARQPRTGGVMSPPALKT